ncbi:hypothetical protein KC878_04280, partial [Candidatus Saccharibacteria bacterium]|nr:hypothetical protein [Candidatus Saccharibacteria bacterium]
LSFFNDQENYADIIEFCDGNDLVEQTALSTYGSGAAGNAIARTIDHPACLDGMLTPSDFEV